jgi:hypothetical protein
VRLLELIEPTRSFDSGRNFQPVALVPSGAECSLTIWRPTANDIDVFTEGAQLIIMDVSVHNAPSSRRTPRSLAAITVSCTPSLLSLSSLRSSRAFPIRGSIPASSSAPADSQVAHAGGIVSGAESYIAMADMYVLPFLRHNMAVCTMLDAASDTR